jgi:hypothetical protein
VIPNPSARDGFNLTRIGELTQRNPALAAKLKAEAERAGTLHPSLRAASATKPQTSFVGR